LNILRTHYTPTQRALAAARRATATHKDAGLLRHPDTVNLLHVGKTVGQAAKEAGVSSSAVTQAKRVLKSAEPEVVAAPPS
jgi:hypothetical protein